MFGAIVANVRGAGVVATASCHRSRKASSVQLGRPARPRRGAISGTRSGPAGAVGVELLAGAPPRSAVSRSAASAAAGSSSQKVG